MAKITIEIDVDDSLFDWGDLLKPKKEEEEITSSETTATREEQDILHDLRILGFKEEIRPDKSPYSDLTIVYEMPHDSDKDRTYEYRVPKHNLDFILKAEKNKLLDTGKVAWITTRPWKGRIREWIRITK